MKLKYILFIFILFTEFFAFATSNDNLNIILDLEGKITQKIKSIIQPVDPEAIVIAQVEIKKISTHLAGTAIEAVGIFSTANPQSVEEQDVQAVNVTVISSMDPFPDDIKKLIDSTVQAFSKKSQIKILKMSDSLAKSIIESKKDKSDYMQRSKAGWQKTSELADQISQITKQLPDFIENIKKYLIMLGIIILIIYGFFQGINLLLQRRLQISSVQIIKEALSSININGNAKKSEKTDEEKEEEELERSSRTKETIVESKGSGQLNGSITTKDNPIEQMYIQLIRDILSDSYWCEKDNYAAWVWSQVSPPKRMELLESWEPLLYYVKYFSPLEPRMENYHSDPIYLKPREYFMHSNEDLLKILRANKYLWDEVSIMRQQAFKMSLKERIDFIKEAKKHPEKPFEWPYTPSALRKLNVQIDMSDITLEDEKMIFENQDFVPNIYRDTIYSLVWTAFLPKEDREKILQKISAPTLAEMWLGPEEMLAKIYEAIPAKKQELLNSYIKKIKPSRNSPVLKQVTEFSLIKLRELYPPIEEQEEVIIPKLDLSSAKPIEQPAEGDGDAAFDIDALVSAFKNGQLDETNNNADTNTNTNSTSTATGDTALESESSTNTHAQTQVQVQNQESSKTSSTIEPVTEPKIEAASENKTSGQLNSSITKEPIIETPQQEIPPLNQEVGKKSELETNKKPTQPSGKEAKSKKNKKQAA